MTKAEAAVTPQELLSAFLAKYPSVKYLRLVHTTYSGIQQLKTVPIYHMSEQAKRAITLRPGDEKPDPNASHGAGHDGPDANGVVLASPCQVHNCFMFLDETGRMIWDALEDGEDGMQVDWTSLKPLQFDPEHAFAHVSLYHVGPMGSLWYGYDYDPRMILRRSVERAKKEHDLDFKVGLELEFTLFDQNDLSTPLTDPQTTIFANQYGNLGMAILTEIAAALEYAGIHVWSFLNESGMPGQYEIQTFPADPVEACDRAVFAAHVVRCIATKHKCLATVSTNPAPGVMTGRHIHISHNHPDEVGNHFIAGMLEHLPALFALHSSSIDSYSKRLVYTGGTHGYWGYNKFCPVHVKGPGRYEARAVDGHLNAHIQVAALIAAGIDGYERKAQPVQTEAFPCSVAKGWALLPADSKDRDAIVEKYKFQVKLPRTLGEALENFKAEQSFWEKALGKRATAGVLMVQEFKWDHREELTEEERRVKLIQKLG